MNKQDTTFSFKFKTKGRNIELFSTMTHCKNQGYAVFSTRLNVSIIFFKESSGSFEMLTYGTYLFESTDLILEYAE